VEAGQQYLLLSQKEEHWRWTAQSWQDSDLAWTPSPAFARLKSAQRGTRPQWRVVQKGSLLKETVRVGYKDHNLLSRGIKWVYETVRVHTFFRKPEVPGFWPSIGFVSCFTTLKSTILQALHTKKTDQLLHPQKTVPKPNLPKNQPMQLRDNIHQLRIAHTMPRAQKTPKTSQICPELAPFPIAPEIQRH
jgi:hypothetical protein